jgi:hypothetical protein
MQTMAVRTRQVHLDFHTSEHIPDVGSRFSKRQFQEALQLGHVNLINIFGKCHHSWSYYPTEIGMMHPTLTFDLLGEQIEACHQIDVLAPIYYTVGWSATDAEQHPEWCVRNRDGSIAARNWPPNAAPDDPRPNTSWKFMCPTGDYLDLILAQTEEICRRYPADGLWYDICNAHPVCFCDHCMRGMAAAGVDLDDGEAALAYSAHKWKHFQQECARLVTSYHPNAVLYFNGTTKLHSANNNVHFRMFENNTQHDLEDLPTTWGGYDKFPLRARFFQTTGTPIVAMSGKFHTSWGEFGGFKHPDALRYEAASMVSYGAACNFGDQLHPLGEMDPDTYRNLGVAYEYVEQIEEYGVGAEPFSNVGLWTTGEEADDEGVTRMLLEIQRDFVRVGPESDLSAIGAIILSGGPCLTRVQAMKLNTFAAHGGGLLVLGESGLDCDRNQFVLNVGATYLGPGHYDVDYTAVGDELGRNIVASPFLNYEPAMRVRPAGDAKVLAAIHEPYFSRTFATYCSHMNTPPRAEPAPHPGALSRGNIVFLPHRLGRMYYAYGARVHRELFKNALRLASPRPTLHVRMPSAARVSVLRQPELRRYVVHLLYAPPLPRGDCQVIEDLVPLYDIPLEFRVPEEITAAYLAPDVESLQMTVSDGVAFVTVPKVECHQAVVFEY